MQSVTRQKIEKETKPLFQYHPDHLERIEDVIVDESKRFLQHPHPLQCKLLALKLLNFDLDESINSVLKQLMELTDQLLSDVPTMESFEERQKASEQCRILLAIINYFSGIQILGLGLRTQSTPTNTES